MPVEVMLTELELLIILRERVRRKDPHLSWRDMGKWGDDPAAGITAKIEKVRERILEAAVASKE